MKDAAIRSMRHEPIGGAIVSNWIPGRVVPLNAPGDDLTLEDMSRVSDDDFADIRSLARRYCRTVDATRSRKRMDSSATVAPNGHARYGTDDVSDDVTQDAVLLFAQRLRNILKSCPTSSMWIDTREVASWWYTKKDGAGFTITRQTLQRWAVRDSAARNGYRLDVEPDEIDGMPATQLMRGLPHAENVASVAVNAGVSQQSEIIWRTAWGDGTDYPTLGRVLFLGSTADDLGRAGVMATVAQALHGGVYGSWRQVARTRDKAAGEWGELSMRLDEVRDELIHHGMRQTAPTSD